MKRILLVATVLCALLLAGCVATSPKISEEGKPSRMASSSDQANHLFETFFQENLAHSPMLQTALGVKTDYGQWDDLSESAAKASLDLKKSQLQRLLKVNPAGLNEPTALSYLLQKRQLEQAIEDHQWRHHSYPVNQMFGLQAAIPSLLINQHRVSDEADALAYIHRLDAIPLLFRQLITGLKIRADKGIIAPAFVFPLAISDSRNLIKGEPFSRGEDSVLYADFKRKVNALALSDNRKTELILKAETALKMSLRPAYESLIRYLQALESRADPDGGAWKLPDGEAFYKHALARTTTTTLTAEDIHQIGLTEVARIQSDIRSIMQQLEFKGSIQEFFTFMREDSRFYYPQTKEGKAQYLADMREIVNTMTRRLDDLFITQPQADIVVQQVEAFREQSAGRAFYQNAAPDGSRPGRFYVNLYDMAVMPRYGMEALAYHEGVPGHHMQISITQELEGVPKFRNLSQYTAYVEGWGLYSEWIPKEVGFYQDPYSDVGRLTMELWRACRLVVDTGIHAKRWTSQEAIDYLKANTSSPERAIVRAVERYMVMPSQATAYKVGMLKIQQLRRMAEERLGSQFDVRQFHDLVLKDGALPLDILEERVKRWVTDLSKGH